MTTTKLQHDTFQALKPEEKRTFSRVCAKVALHLEVHLEDMLDPKNREADPTHARRVAMYLTRSFLPALTVAHIGALFDKSDSTVSKDVQLVWAQAIRDLRFRSILDAIRSDIDA